MLLQGLHSVPGTSTKLVFLCQGTVAMAPSSSHEVPLDAVAWIAECRALRSEYIMPVPVCLLRMPVRMTERVPSYFGLSLASFMARRMA